MKRMIPFISAFLVMLLLWGAATYGVGYLLELPLPLLPKTDPPDYSAQNVLMEQWSNVRVYQVKEKQQTVEEIIEEAKPETIVDTSEQLFYSLFPEIDKESMASYLGANGDLLTNGYGQLFIDNAEKEVVPTQLKTILGDDILTIDVHDNLMIVGVKVGDTEEVNGKLVILKNPKQLNLAVTSDINYWEKAEKLAQDNNGILAIPASGYNYFETGRYFTVKGMLVREGETIRKSTNASLAVGFDEDGYMSVGDAVEVESTYNAVEAASILIKDGTNLISAEESNIDDNIRIARTAIGQSFDGTTYMLVVDGGDKSGSGATLKEVADTLEAYGAENAAELIGGNRAVMYWNSKILNNADNYSEDGMLLPNTFIITPYDGEGSIIYTEIGDGELPGITPEENENLVAPEDEKGPGALTPEN